MRRLVANSILVITLGIYFAPAITASVSNPVPICCRRGGAHHCEMMVAAEMKMDAGGIAFRCNNPCPMRQGPQLGSSVVALPVSQTAEIELQRQSLAGAVVARPHFTLAHADHQRGPPELLS